MYHDLLYQELYHEKLRLLFQIFENQYGKMWLMDDDETLGADMAFGLEDEGVGARRETAGVECGRVGVADLKGRCGAA